jgi:hypothetical protein
VNALASLTTCEQSQLERNEAVIAKGVDTFREVGEALQEIRDNRLYRATHKTFADYCEQKWGMGRAHAARLIDASEIVRELSPIGDKIHNEATARAVAKVEPAKRAEVVEKAAAKAESEGRKLQARDVSEAREALPAMNRVGSMLEAATGHPVQFVTNDGKPLPKYTPSNGLMYGQLAIDQLKKIQPNDTQKAAGLRLVAEWANQQLSLV